MIERNENESGLDLQSECTAVMVKCGRLLTRAAREGGKDVANGQLLLKSTNLTVAVLGPNKTEKIAGDLLKLMGMQTSEEASQLAKLREARKRTAQALRDYRAAIVRIQRDAAESCDAVAAYTLGTVLKVWDEAMKPLENLTGEGCAK